MRKKKRRVYISIYFADGEIGAHKRRDLTIAMDMGSALWCKCKNLGSSKIKQIIGVETYSELISRARRADRTLGGYIKNKLKKHFGILE